MNFAPGIFFIVAVSIRLVSVLVSRRNEARLRAEGAEEYGAGNSRLLAMLHSIFYIAAFVEGGWRGTPGDWLTWSGLALYIFAMLALLYVIRALGGLWTVRVMLAPAHTLRRDWFFRTFRHPNYYLNILPELLAMVLIMKAWLTLVLVFPPYLVALACRIRIEEAAMRQRFSAY
jgi:isoprenylcysteine carboxyl methyltransferase (ICMT) family protein YpbQ